MSRLYDRVMGGHLSYVVDHTSQAMDGLSVLNAAIPNAQVIVIDPVARYFFESVDRYISWRITDFPNLAPPFEDMWVEFSGKCCAPLVAGIPEAQLFHSIGVFLKTIDTKTYQKDKLRPLAPFVSVDEWNAVRWIIHGMAVHSSDRHSLALARASFAYAVNQDGSIASSTFQARLFAKPQAEWNQEEEGYISTYARSFLYPVFLAVSFMHCKNVKLIDEPIPPKLAKAYQKRHGRPMVKYKTLEITPMKEVLRREGKSETLGLKRALHICRGHFANYTEKGLFGRHHGIYWWDAHVRGTAERGAVVKDYKIKEPIEP